MSSCPSHEALVALWGGELDEAETAAVDEHLFGCDSCAAATQAIAKIVAALRGQTPFVISRAHRERLVAAGTRIHVVELDPTPDRTATQSARFAPGVDLLLFALRGDLSNADRVDLEIASPTGEPRYRLEDVPFDRSTGEVLVACRRHYEGMFPAGDPIFTVHAIEAGERRPVADYVVEHIWR